MLVVHIITNLTRGGAEQMMKRLIAEQLEAGGVRHHVISLREKATVGPDIEALGVEVEALGLRGMAGTPAAIWRIARILRRLKPDVVQTWLYHADLIGGVAARLAGMRNVVWSIRASDMSASHGLPMLTSAIRGCCALLSRWVPERIIYVGEASREAHERLGYDPAKSVVIPNGYGIPERPDAAARAALRRELNVPEDARLIGTAGRFHKVKDYPTFIAAAAGIADRYPELCFLMVGRGLDPGNPELAKGLAAAGVSERFILVGERHPIGPYLAGLDLFCLHSLSEGFPNVVAEAMAMGVPCVVTDVGDAALLVGETGLVVPPRQPDALGKALARLLDEAPQDRRRRSDSARRRIEDHFSIAAIRAQYEAVHSQVAGGLAAARDTQV